MNPFYTDDNFPRYEKTAPWRRLVELQLINWQLNDLPQPTLYGSYILYTLYTNNAWFEVSTAEFCPISLLHTSATDSYDDNNVMLNL